MTRDARRARPPGPHAVVFCALTLTSVVSADEERAFYKHYDYGSQSLQTPVYALLNRGFDNLQLRNGRRGMQVSLVDTRNVLENLASPFDAIERTGEGWKTFVTSEALPLSFGQNSARWIPNYGLHLLGGGQTFAWVREWFLDHEAPEPLATAFAAATLLTGALVNESIENKGVRGANTDAIADIYLFDLGGIFLFSVPAVRRFFSKTLILSDWSLQPAITFPEGHLHNVGNYYSLKIPLYDRLRLFVYGGVSTLGGLSLRLGDGYSLSVAGGVRGDRFENIGGATVLSNVVRFKPSGALFLDRNESLLAVVQVSDVRDYLVSANMYPNAFLRTDPGLGAWTAIGRDGWVLGVSFTRALGLGFGLGTR